MENGPSSLRTTNLGETKREWYNYKKGNKMGGIKVREGNGGGGGVVRPL